MREKRLAHIFAENLLRKRKLLGLSQDELAERLGIAQQSMSRMERGVMAPKFERLPDIARELHCTVASLFVDQTAGGEDTQDVLSNVLCDLSETERVCVMRFVIDAAGLLKGARMTERVPATATAHAGIAAGGRRSGRRSGATAGAAG